MPPPGVCLNIMEARHKQDGYGSLKTPYRVFDQDFQQLAKYCLSQRVKFLDETFPPERSSIGEGVLSPSDLAKVEWLRPAVSGAEICIQYFRSKYEVLLG